MEITLCIESSALPYGVVLATTDGICYDSTLHEELAEIKDVAQLTRIALDASGLPASAIRRIIVNQGPGGTSSIRTGVAFANSLGYSLKVPVFPVNAFELMGFAAEMQWNCPAIVTVKSIKQQAYIGWFAAGRLRATHYGLPEAIIPDLIGDLPTLAVAGAHRESIKRLFPKKEIHDTNMKFGRASDMPRMEAIWSTRATMYPSFVIPLTEQSSLFENPQP
ncbi:MAG: hypothetical protein R2795_02980 [Saprospiraceae bacterium]